MDSRNNLTHSIFISPLLDSFSQLAGEVLALCHAFLEKNIHPIVIISGLRKALQDAQAIMQELATPINLSNDPAMMRLIKASVNTKFSGRFGDLMCHLALKAVRIVAVTESDGRKDVDIKRYVRVEKIPGGDIEDSSVLDGIILNKDITHPKMRRNIPNPRILLLDCPLEYKKGESQTNLELMKDGDWERVLAIEEEQIKDLCEKIISLKPDLVFTEKGISGMYFRNVDTHMNNDSDSDPDPDPFDLHCTVSLDLAQHYFVKHDITAIRRVRKMDSHRIARAVGATIVNRVDELKESDIGTGCGLFHIEKIGDEYFTYLEKCKDPKACSIVLRGASKDVLNELERDLQDALCVARNVHYQPKLLPGGGATEMALAVKLAMRSRSLISAANSVSDSADKATTVSSLISGPYKAVAEALEVIPRTLVSNCGGDVIRTLTELRAKHAEGFHTWGVDGMTGKLVDMANHPGGMDSSIWEPLAVKLQTLQTAVEVSPMSTIMPR